MLEKTYDNGNVALRFNEDGTGFIYYPNGSVAVCASEASSYQKSFYAYDKNRKKTLLLAIDENGVGFCTGSKRKDLKGLCPDMALTKVGGLITSPEGNITHSWKWDPKAQNSGALPSSRVIFSLNEHISLHFTSKFDMLIKFEYDAIKYELDAAVKFKRSDSYLDHAKRGLGGRLIPQMEHVTLKDRQERFGKEMAAQRNKLHPRSENLSPMVCSIVGKLENGFDNIRDTMRVEHGHSSTWKEDALATTLREVPRIPLAGVETGISPGLSQTIYVDGPDSLAKTAPARLLTESGQWKDSSSVRTVLRTDNPPLSRASKILRASGRYSDMLVVDPSAVTSDNPTGMIETMGLPLSNVSWDLLKRNFPAGSVAPTDPLTVALLMRGGDPVSCNYLRITELVNKDINGSNQRTQESRVSPGEGSPSRPASGLPKTGGATAAPPQLVKIDVSENNNIVMDLGIKSIPTFLMFHGARLVYAGPVGGRKVKLDSTHHPQILLIESNFRDQVSAEKALRRLGCDTFLCLGMSEAVTRVQQMCKNASGANGHAREPVIFDIVLISEDVGADNITMLQKELSEYVKIRRTVVAMLVSVLGEHGRSNLQAVKWESACTSDVSAFNKTAFSSLCSMAIQKPVKPMAIEKLLSLREVPQNDSNFGLTPKTLKSKIAQVQKDVLNCTTKDIKHVGIRMSAHDTRMRGGIDLASS